MTLRIISIPLPLTPHGWPLEGHFLVSVPANFKPLHVGFNYDNDPALYGECTLGVHHTELLSMICFSPTMNYARPEDEVWNFLSVINCSVQDAVGSIPHFYFLVTKAPSLQKELPL